MHTNLQLSKQLRFETFLINVQENLAVDSEFALDQVSFSTKEQNLPMLFDEGENSQVMKCNPTCAALHWDKHTDTNLNCLAGIKK